MTQEKKQIKIDDLLPLLKTGWVAMDFNGQWWWYEEKPQVHEKLEIWLNTVKADRVELGMLFNIAPFDGDWKDSLMEVK